MIQRQNAEKVNRNRIKNQLTDQYHIDQKTAGKEGRDGQRMRNEGVSHRGEATMPESSIGVGERIKSRIGLIRLDFESRKGRYIDMLMNSTQNGEDKIQDFLSSAI